MNDAPWRGNGACHRCGKSPGGRKRGRTPALRAVSSSSFPGLRSGATRPSLRSRVSSCRSAGRLAERSYVFGFGFPLVSSAAWLLCEPCAVPRRSEEHQVRQFDATFQEAGCGSTLRFCVKIVFSRLSVRRAAQRPSAQEEHEPRPAPRARDGKGSCPRLSARSGPGPAGLAPVIRRLPPGFARLASSVASHGSSAGASGITPRRFSPAGPIAAASGSARGPVARGAGTKGAACERCCLEQVHEVSPPAVRCSGGSRKTAGPSSANRESRKAR